jgi:hypothetical protein
VCIRTTPSRLMLEVSANHSWTSLFMQRHQVRLGYRVRALGGRFAWGTRKDGTKFTRLYVPVAP